jgi:DNA-binding NarL/FixJ family response regulator
VTNDKLGPSLAQDPDPVAAVALQRRMDRVVFASELGVLAPREQETLVLLCKGLRNNEIAQIMKITSATVENYRNNIRSKLACSLMEAAVIAAKAEIV